MYVGIHIIYMRFFFTFLRFDAKYFPLTDNWDEETIARTNRTRYTKNAEKTQTYEEEEKKGSKRAAKVCYFCLIKAKL